MCGIGYDFADRNLSVRSESRFAGKRYHNYTIANCRHSLMSLCLTSVLTVGSKIRVIRAVTVVDYSRLAVTGW